MLWVILIIALGIIAGMYGYQKLLKPPCGCGQ